MRTSSTMFVLATLALSPAAALGQLHQGDILIELNGADRIVTGVVDDKSGAVVHNVRVFLGTFEAGLNFTNEPGLDSDAVFPPDSRLGFTIRRALRVWANGNFDTIPVERIEVRLGSLGPIVTPTSDVEVEGFSMPVDVDGVFHHHPGYLLRSPAGDGIYLYEFELCSDLAGISPSQPLWLVLNQNRSQKDHEEAAQWVRDNLECRADFDGDGFITGLDFDSFVFAFEAGDLTADFDQDGFITGIDYDTYVYAFEQGCNP